MFLQKILDQLSHLFCSDSILMNLSLLVDLCSLLILQEKLEHLFIQEGISGLIRISGLALIDRLDSLC